MKVPVRTLQSPVFVLAIVLGASLYANLFWLWQESFDAKRAAGRIAAGFQPGDALATRPWWAQRIREHLGTKPMVLVRDLAAEDLSAYARLWVLALPGADDYRTGPFADGTYRLQTEETLPDGQTITLWALGAPAQVLFNFRARLDQARVSVVTRGGDKPCDRWLKDRWICSPAGWNFVGQMIMEIGADPRALIWAHPSDQGPLTIAYDEVPHGNTLLVHTGLTPAAARVQDGTPVELLVTVDGHRAGLAVHPNESHWLRHPIDLTAFGPGPHKVRFQITSERIGMRHFGFTAEVRR